MPDQQDKHKRSVKRKRNMIQKELRTNGPKPQRIEGRRPRHEPPKVTVKDWDRRWDVC